MPDLNLIEEEGAEATQGDEELYAPSEEMDDGGGNKVVKMVIMVVAVAVLGGGGYFLLNSLGVIGGKKPAAVVQQVQEPSTETEREQPGVAQGTESGQVNLVETPALNAKGKSGATSDKSGTKTAASSTAPASVAGKKVSEMTGEYTVQVSAFRGEGQAETIKKRLEEAGYPAFVEAREHKDGTWYTVRIGRFPSRKVAEKAVADFALELRSSYWVDRIRSR